jgi:hypothetical protein
MWARVSPAGPAPIIPTCVLIFAMCSFCWGCDLEEFLDHFFWHSLPFGFRRIARKSHRPHAFFDSFDRQSVSAKKLMLHGEAATAPFRDAGVHLDNVAERRWNDEIATGLDQGNAINLVLAKHLGFLDP